MLKSLFSPAFHAACDAYVAGSVTVTTRSFNLWDAAFSTAPRRDDPGQKVCHTVIPIPAMLMRVLKASANVAVCLATPF
jgi:hypothetical protein